MDLKKISMEQNKRLLKQFHAICNKLGMTTEDRKRFVAELGHQSSSEMSDLELSLSISELTSIYVANNRRLNTWRRRVMAVIFEHFRLQNKEVSKEYVIAVATRQTKNKDGRFNEIEEPELIRIYNYWLKRNNKQS